MMRAVRASSRLKFLRGTPFDPFGYTAERRTERKLIADYEALLDEVLPKLNAGKPSPSRSGLPPSRKKSAASATSSCAISTPRRPTRRRFSSNSAPARRPFLKAAE